MGYSMYIYIYLVCIYIYIHISYRVCGIWYVVHAIWGSLKLGGPNVDPNRPI